MVLMKRVMTQRLVNACLRKSKVVQTYRCCKPPWQSYQARTVLGWDPLKTSYEQLCAIMSKHDRQLAEKEATQKLMIR